MRTQTTPCFVYSAALRDQRKLSSHKPNQLRHHNPLRCKPHSK